MFYYFRHHGFGVQGLVQCQQQRPGTKNYTVVTKHQQKEMNTKLLVCVGVVLIPGALSVTFLMHVEYFVEL